MSSTRFPMAGGRRLVLVRGGLDDAHRDDGGDGGADWQDFCRRIGWQPPGPAPADDFEERLGERLLVAASGARVSGARASGARASGADNVVRIDVARRPAIAPAREGRAGEVSEADFGHGDAEPAPSRWGRLGFAVAMTLAVAAVACFVVAKLVSSNLQTSAASLPELSAHADRQSAVAPSVDRALPVSPSVAPDVRSPHVEEPTAKPAPSARPPRFARPRPPGARVAIRSAEAAQEGRALAARRPAESDLATTDLVKSEDRPVAWGTVARDRVVVPVADSVALAPAPVRVSAGVWSNRGGATGATEPEQARTVGPSWSLSPANARWFGATVTPPLPRGVAPASVGVMAQLDLGKALGRL